MEESAKSFLWVRFVRDCNIRTKTQNVASLSKMLHYVVWNLKSYEFWIIENSFRKFPFPRPHLRQWGIFQFIKKKWNQIEKYGKQRGIKIRFLEN